MITAQTGFVGIRLPNHPVAQNLIKTSQLPIAAPSANKFGHVSPTTAKHVYNDFHKDTDVLIIDGGCCDFGIESTVLKIELAQGGESTQYKLTIVRKGGISMANLKHTIDQAGLAEVCTLE